MRKKVSKADKVLQEKNRQEAQRKQSNKTLGIVIAVISVILVLSMVLASVRF